METKFVPLTTELSLRLCECPFLLPLERDRTLPLTTVRSCFEPTAIGLKYAENQDFKVVTCKCSKFYPPKKNVLNPYIVIYESLTTDTAHHHLSLQTSSDNPFKATRQNQRPANFPSQPNTSAPHTWSFSDLEVENLDIEDFKLEASLLEKWWINESINGEKNQNT